MENINRLSSAKTLRRHGKSFYLASIFLGRKTASAAARLYRFCRILDDYVDNTRNPLKASAEVESWKKQIANNNPLDPLIHDILNFTKENSIDKHYVIHLINGLKIDTNLVLIEDEEKLIQYCYLVAGSVGLMMCPILRAKNNDAYKFALDLGIAMQLTNILRDVAEDALKGRQYLPRNWLPTDYYLSNRTEINTHKIKPALIKLFNLAQIYYQSGYSGICYLPKRNQLAILIAARLYQEIAFKAKRMNYEVTKKRIVVSKLTKYRIVAECLLKFLRASSSSGKMPKHNQKLHQSLANFVNLS